MPPRTTAVIPNAPTTAQRISRPKRAHACAAFAGSSSGERGTIARLMRLARRVGKPHMAKTAPLWHNRAIKKRMGECPMTIAKVIAGRQREIFTCKASATVEEAARILSERRIGAMPVLQDGRLGGIFSERDLLYCVAREGAGALYRRVSEVMTAPAITVA